MMSGGPLARRPGSGSTLERGGQAQLAQMQIFSGGVARSERALAGTDGSVEQVQSNIAKAVQAFGPTPGGKSFRHILGTAPLGPVRKMMQAEKLAAEEAIRTGLYGVGT